MSTFRHVGKIGLGKDEANFAVQSFEMDIATADTNNDTKPEREKNGQSFYQWLKSI